MSQLKTAVYDGDHVQGPASAPVTLVEYGDFECPTCGQAYPIVKHVQKHFGDQLRFVFRQFPLEQHPMAEPAAEASEFAAAQGKFWPMHDGLFENQEELGPELFDALAKELHLNPKAMEKALADGEFEDRVTADVEDGEASGVMGTPTFYINGRQHAGSFDAATLIRSIEAVLK
ncbi:MAG TPA: thioredoxin domain-containing protein [Acidobacteriaceae bacterium]|nr:thioredoxin domain-containing protein [Acidobacteriaceae bacterium]